MPKAGPGSHNIISVTLPCASLQVCPWFRSVEEGWLAAMGSTFSLSYFICWGMHMCNACPSHRYCCLRMHCTHEPFSMLQGHLECKDVPSQHGNHHEGCTCSYFLATADAFLSHMRASCMTGQFSNTLPCKHVLKRVNFQTMWQIFSVSDPKLDGWKFVFLDYFF